MGNAEFTKIIIATIITVVSGGVFYGIFKHIIVQYFKDIDTLKTDHGKLREEFAELKGGCDSKHKK